FLDDVGDGRLKELAVKERYLERSFRVVVSRHADRLLEMEAKSGAGQDMSLAIGREQRLMEEAKRRQQDRLAEVRLEQQLVPRAPEFLGVATVLPREATTSIARAGDQLIEKVRSVEESAGREFDDARGLELGYDAVSRKKDGQDVRFMAIRRVEDDGRIWLRGSEWAQVQHLGSQYTLYAAQGDRLFTVSGREAELAATTHTNERRVSIRLAGLQLPLAAQRDA